MSQFCSESDQAHSNLEGDDDDSSSDGDGDNGETAMIADNNNDF